MRLCHFVSKTLGGLYLAMVKRENVSTHSAFFIERRGHGTFRTRHLEGL